MNIHSGEKPKHGIIIRIPMAPDDGMQGYCVYHGVNVETNELAFSNAVQMATKTISTHIATVHALGEIKTKKMNGDVYIQDADVKKAIDEDKFEFILSNAPGVEKTREMIKRCATWLAFNTTIPTITLIDKNEKIL